MMKHAVIKYLFSRTVLDKIRLSSAYHGVTKPATVCPTRQHSTYEEEIEELRIQQIQDQDIPEPSDSTKHEVMNFFIQGYDCTSVEHFAQFAHNLAKNMDLTIFDRLSSAYHGVTKPATVCPTRQHSTYEEEIEELRIQQIQDQDIPEPSDSTKHEVMNFFIQGYDCTSVEHFAQFAHNLAKNMDLTIFDSYALPTKHTLVHTIQAPGTAEKNRLKDFSMRTHQRVVQLQELQGTIAPVFLEVLQINLPEGVSLKVEPHSQYHHKERYIQKEIPPDLL